MSMRISFDIDDTSRPPYERMRLMEAMAMILSPMNPEVYRRLRAAWDRAQEEILEGLETSFEETPDDCFHQMAREERMHPYVPERREDRMACQKCGDELFPWRMVRLTKEIL